MDILKHKSFVEHILYLISGLEEGSNIQFPLFYYFCNLSLEINFLRKGSCHITFLLSSAEYPAQKLFPPKQCTLVMFTSLPGHRTWDIFSHIQDLKYGGRGMMVFWWFKACITSLFSDKIFKNYKLLNLRICWGELIDISYSPVIC